MVDDDGSVSFLTDTAKLYFAQFAFFKSLLLPTTVYRLFSIHSLLPLRHYSRYAQANTPDAPHTPSGSPTYFSPPYSQLNSVPGSSGDSGGARRPRT